MIDIETIIAANIPLIIAVLFISIFPLYFAVKSVGGTTGIIRGLFIGLFLSFASLGAAHFIDIIAGVFMLLATLIAYKIAFRISFAKAFMVWILQYIFVVITTSAVLFLF